MTPVREMVHALRNQDRRFGKYKTRGPRGPAGFVLPSTESTCTHLASVIHDITVDMPSQLHCVRACPKRDSNPHAVAGTHLRDACVCQFRHSGTSTKTAELRNALTSFFSLPRRHDSAADASNRPHAVALTSEPLQHVTASENRGIDRNQLAPQKCLDDCL